MKAAGARGRTEGRGENPWRMGERCCPHPRAEGAPARGALLPPPPPHSASSSAVPTPKRFGVGPPRTPKQHQCFRRQQRPARGRDVRRAYCHPPAPSLPPIWTPPDGASPPPSLPPPPRAGPHGGAPKPPRRGNLTVPQTAHPQEGPQPQHHPQTLLGGWEPSEPSEVEISAPPPPKGPPEDPPPHWHLQQRCAPPPLQELWYCPPHPTHTIIPSSSSVSPPQRGMASDPPASKTASVPPQPPLCPPPDPPIGHPHPTAAGGRALGVSPPVVPPHPHPPVPPTCATAPDRTGTAGLSAPNPALERAVFLAEGTQPARLPPPVSYGGGQCPYGDIGERGGGGGPPG